MKKIFPMILLLIFVAYLSGCAHYFNTKSATEKRVDIIIAETYNKYQDHEIEFERLTIDFPEYREEYLNIAPEIEKVTSQLAADGSQIETLYDGFGNKTETRTFFNDELIKFVVIKTSPNGQKKAFVYAQNGEVKALPENLLEKILFLPVSEIAKSVEIFEGWKENEMLAGLRKPQANRIVMITPSKEGLPPTVSEPEKVIVNEEKATNPNSETTEKNKTQSNVPEK